MIRILVVALGIFAAAAPAGAQRRAAGMQRPTVGVAIALKVGARAYDFTGQASCTHAPVASIYGVMAEQWTVEQSDGPRSLTMTVWKPKNGSADMLSLAVSTPAGSSVVDTVKAASAPPAKGSGTVKFTPTGNGGTFTLDAKGAEGSAISGTVRCDAFLPAMAEGGE